MADFDINTLTGLTDQQAAQRLQDEGYNDLPSSRRRNIFAIAWNVIREPMFLLLVACGVVYLLIGEPKEACMLLGFVFFVMAITFVQERRTERALESLRDLSSPRALVIRDGRRLRIAGREVARGDIILLVEGDRVPADAVLLHTINLYLDESLLTGESVPVRKAAVKSLSDNIQMARPGGDDLPFVFSGTMVTGGQGVAEVRATGIHSEIGKIGKAIQTIEPEDTLLQKETSSLVKKLSIVGLLLCALVVILYGLTRGNDSMSWKRGLLAGIAMAMATLPEELPVVLTIFLALGAWRISRQNVLTRRIPAIEMLGSATVLCVDKTGTLTQNTMSISRLFVDGKYYDVTNAPDEPLPEYLHRLVEFGILASKCDPFDPMEKALKQLGRDHLARTEHLHDDWIMVKEYPLSPGLLALSHVWKCPVTSNLVIAAKGAPEAVADLCHFTPDQTDEIVTRVASMANDGLRVLGVARGISCRKDLPSEQHDFTFEFLGLIGLADPIRLAVPPAISDCHNAGISVVMITGDYPKTAQNIARQIGLSKNKNIITGPELDNLSDEELSLRAQNTNIFARVVPEQKLRIVNAIKKNNQVVAMTGDGVNDVPALRSAHIGIGMGGRGTDVAREASDLVLLDDDFSSIVKAIRLGRRIFDNIRKAIAYVFAIHVPIAGLSLIPVFFPDWPLILMPVHIVFLELIIDPACSIVFEAEDAEPDIMTRPPRKPTDRLFDKRLISVSLLQGFIVLAVVLTLFVTARRWNYSEDTARGLAFASLVIANVLLILANRSWSRTIFSMFKMPNKALPWVVIGAVVLLVGVLTIPVLRTLFHFDKLNLIDIVICLAAGILSVLWFEILKLFNVFRKPIKCQK